MMGKRGKKYRFLVACLILLAMISFTAIEAWCSNVQSYVEENNIIIYLQNIPQDIQNVTAQIGKSAAPDVTIEPPEKVSGCSIHTTILFDNSLSISKANRQKMKDAAKKIVQKHCEGQVFSLATFDTECRTLLTDSTDYEELCRLIDGIEYINQDTYLKEVLYDAFKNADTDTQNYQNFIVLSDGSDDKEVGYTYGEICALLETRNYQVISIGSRYEKNLNALKEMFSISRTANSPYFLLDDTDDLESITNQIKDSMPMQIALVQIPDEVQDGSEKRVKLSLDDGNTKYDIVTTVEMLFWKN